MIEVSVYKKVIIGDQVTPLSIYKKIREQSPASILLESGDETGGKHMQSFISYQPLLSFTAIKNRLHLRIGNETEIKPIQQNFANTILAELEKIKSDSPEDVNFFGFNAYHAVEQMENIQVNQSSTDFPSFTYHLFGKNIIYNHRTNELILIALSLHHESGIKILSEIENDLLTTFSPDFPFETIGNETSSHTDEEFKTMVKKGIHLCEKGDVFQIVLSRSFSQTFIGDDLEVYRHLRNINPSPFQFYFDNGNFRIFGASPEAQLIVKNATAELFPIAGTFKRSGTDEQDLIKSKELLQNEKENAEHMMLVDLARNDLSKSCRSVKVDQLKYIQIFSHVIHMVSKISGKIQNGKHALNILSDSFPAGTLSGAPKYRAMEEIKKCEGLNRNYYGGAIGFFNLKGDLTKAIMIRTAMVKGNTISFRAGAGVVINSEPDSELQEVYNKTNAIRSAIARAEIKQKAIISIQNNQ